MKQKKLTKLAALFVAAATLTVTSSYALTSIQIQEIKTAVLSVPVPEIPAKAAILVKNAQKKDRQAVAVTVVRAVVAKHKAAAPLVISAIAKVAPELAPAVAAVGAELAGEQAPMIASAVVTAAPAQAALVNAAMAKVVPQQATSVAAAVNRSVMRGAAQGPGGGTGVITYSDTPIDDDGFGFPGQAPGEADEPRVIYNQPPQ